MNNLAGLMASWRNLPVRTRLLVTAGAALVAAVLAAVAVLESRGPRYVPLFSDLDTKDAADVVARLEDQKIPYRLADNGRTIDVPEPVVHRTRLDLASQGLPRSGVVGLEIMDKFNLGATDFDKRVQYLRAVQGELTRTIEQIEGVRAARVHLNVPEPSLFVRDKQPASASILLSLRPGTRLEPAQVRGIAHLVAGSVEGLKPDDVTILDDEGQILEADLGGSQGGSAVTSNNLKIQENFQKTLERNLMGLLEQVLGRGNVVARVTAEMNFDQKSVDNELWQPVANNEGILRSVQEIEETFRGQGSPGGITGISANDGSFPNYAAGTVNGETYSSKVQRTKQFEINRIREQVTVAPGAVKRLSVSVVVNRRLSADQEAQIRDLVKTAVGLDASRQDQITVTGLPFSTAEEAVTKPAEPAKESPAWVRYAIYGGGAAAVLLAFVIATVFARRRARREKARLAENLLELQRKAAREQEEALAQQSEQREEWSATARLQAQVSALARQKPEEVAQIIRSWLSEE